jgi:hypothetical protein
MQIANAGTERLFCYGPTQAQHVFIRYSFIFNSRACLSFNIIAFNITNRGLAEASDINPAYSAILQFVL